MPRTRVLPWRNTTSALAVGANAADPNPVLMSDFPCNSCIFASLYFTSPLGTSTLFDRLDPAIPPSTFGCLFQQVPCSDHVDLQRPPGRVSGHQRFVRPGPPAMAQILTSPKSTSSARILTGALRWLASSVTYTATTLRAWRRFAPRCECTRILSRRRSLTRASLYCSAATKELLLQLERFPCRINYAKGILEARVMTYKHLKNLLVRCSRSNAKY